MKKVWIAQLKCPSNHCVLALYGEFESGDQALYLVHQLGMGFAEAVKRGLLNQKCDICQSTDLTPHLAATVFRTMEEAKEPLAEAERAQLETQRFLKAGRN